jgi:hypothetical protein
MNKIALTLLLLGSSVALADSKPAPAKAVKAENGDDAKMKEKIEAMEKAEAPGPMHQWLKTNLAGSWTTETHIFMGPKPMVSTGSAEIKPIHGDRFLVEELSGSRMGKPMSLTAWYGYDKRKNTFVAAEIDSAGTGLTSLTGSLDEKTNTLTLTGNSWSHMLNKEVPIRLVIKADSDKKFVLELYSPGPDGKEAKRIETVHTRK